MAKATMKKVPVSERALVQRINRLLAKDEIASGGYKLNLPGRLYKTRLDQHESQLRDLGRYHAVSFQNGLQYTFPTLESVETFARDIGALQAFEGLVEDPKGKR